MDHHLNPEPSERRPPVTVAEIRARRLVIEDTAGHPRIVAEVVGDAAEVRVELPTSGPRRRSHLLLCAVPADGNIGPTLAVQLWADGNAVAGICAWADPDGTWRTDQPAHPT